MPLSKQQVKRDLYHTRTVAAQGFRRDDGLWDIEGRITDIKPYSFENSHRGIIQAGEPLHEMWVRLTLTDDMEVKAVEAVTDHAPFGICPSITPNFQRLVGLKIAAGWNKAVQERVGGVQGCTHIVDLLKTVATAAFQTIVPVLARERKQAEGLKSGDNPPSAPFAKGQKPPLLNTCHAFDEQGELAQTMWPDWYKDHKKGS